MIRLIHHYMIPFHPMVHPLLKFLLHLDQNLHLIYLYSVIRALTGLTIGYSVTVALTGLTIGYSVIVTLTGLPIGNSTLVSL